MGLWCVFFWVWGIGGTKLDMLKAGSPFGWLLAFFGDTAMGTEAARDGGELSDFGEELGTTQGHPEVGAGRYSPLVGESNSSTCGPFGDSKWPWEPQTLVLLW